MKEVREVHERRREEMPTPVVATVLSFPIAAAIGAVTGSKSVVELLSFAVFGGIFFIVVLAALRQMRRIDTLRKG